MKRSVKTNEMIVADDAFDIADYPACKFFLPITETTGVDFTDIVGNQVLTMSAVISGSLTHSDYSVNNNDLIGFDSDTSETLPDLGTTKDFIYFVVCDFGSTDNLQSLIGGGVSDPQVKVVKKAAAPGTAIRDTTPTTSNFSSIEVDGNTQAFMLSTDRSDTKAYLAETDGVAASSVQNVVLTATAGMDLDEGAGKVSFPTDTDVFGVALFTFDTIPSDIIAAMSWMNYQWRQGNKVIYPAWKNKT